MKTPKFKITMDGADASATLGARLVSLKVTDAEGWQSDKLELTLDNSDGRFEAPFPECEIGLQLGYAGETPRDFGTFFANKIQTTLSPRVVKIECAALCKGAGGDEKKKELFKGAVTREWSENETVGGALSAIAAECGYGARVSASLKDAPLPAQCLVENNETHGEFLRRMAQVVGATMKTSAKTLFFYDAAEAAASAAPVEVSASALSAATFAVERSEQFKSTEAAYGSADGFLRTVSAGTGTPVKKLKGEYASEAEALAAAEAELANLRRKTKTCKLSGEADVRICVGEKIRLTGTSLYPELEAGTWTVTKTEFSLSRSGLTMSVEAGL